MKKGVPFWLLVCFSLACWPSQAIAGKNFSLQKTSEWDLSYDSRRCDLVARFGADDNEVIAKFSRMELSDTFDLTLIGKSLTQGGKRLTSDAKLDLGARFGVREINAKFGKAGSVPVLFLGRINLTQSQAQPGLASFLQPPKNALASQDLNEFTSLTLQISGDSFRLETGPMAGALLGLRSCMDEVVKLWGYQPDVLQTLISLPRPLNDPGDWILYKDYPRSQLRSGKQGLIDVRLDVGEDGAVAKCTILSEIGDQEFSDAVCKGMQKRAKFSPALNRAGNPIAAFHVARVHFSMEFD